MIDNITTDEISSLVLTGSAEANSTVKIWISSAPQTLATTTVNSSGNWQITGADLGLATQLDFPTDGVYTCYTTATNADGYESDIASKKVIIDFIPGALYNLDVEHPVHQTLAIDYFQITENSNLSEQWAATDNNAFNKNLTVGSDILINPVKQFTQLKTKKLLCMTL